MQSMVVFCVDTGVLCHWHGVKSRLQHRKYQVVCRCHCEQGGPACLKVIKAWVITVCDIVSMMICVCVGGGRAGEKSGEGGLCSCTAGGTA